MDSLVPFHLTQKTQGPSHIPIPEGKLHLRCLWKVGSPLHSKTGNQLSSWHDMGCMELSSCCCTDINIHIDLRRVSQGISSFLKEVKPLVLYAVEHGIAMEKMKGKLASSRVDLGYTELFCIPEVTPVFISPCDSVLGDSLVFHQENRVSLCV